MSSTATPSSGGIPPPVPNRVLDDPDDWEYFGEGANNVLYRYVGADSFFVRRSLSSVIDFASPTSSDLDLEIIFAPSPEGTARLTDDPAATQSSS